MKNSEELRRENAALRSLISALSAAACPVRWKAIEYELLRVLSVNAGRVMQYESLLRQVWGRREFDDVRPLRAYVKSVRRTLGDDAANPACIFTVRQVGYQMPKPRDT